jgi:antitoxin MazE
MRTTVEKWGGSIGLRLSSELLADAHIEVGDEVEVALRDGALVVTPRRIRSRASLRELVRRIPTDYTAGEYDWGQPTGHEVF